MKQSVDMSWNAVEWDVRQTVDCASCGALRIFRIYMSGRALERRLELVQAVLRA